jgi:hypothetical protein
MKKADDELNKNPESDASDSDDNEESRDRNAVDENDLPPAGNRGERADNLRRRSDWFQKRTGGR